MDSSTPRQKRAYKVGRVPIAAFALGAVAILAIAGAALACFPPTGQNGSCDAAGRHWILTKDQNYSLVEYSLVSQSSNKANSDWVDITITGATYELVTDSSVNQIWWALQPNAYKGQSNAVETMTWNVDKNPCPTPTPTLPPTATPTLPPTATPTLPPTATPTLPPTATPTLPPTATPTLPPTATPTLPPTATPTESFGGETATPTVAPTATAVESVGGETATPVASVTAPPTSTTGSGSGNNSTPIFALLICVAFGALGLAAVQTQRRSIHR